MERVSICVDWDDPSPEELKGYFAEIFVSLDERPRPLLLSVATKNDTGTRFAVAMREGEPVFTASDGRSVKASFRGRWIALHPSPLEFSFYGKTRLVLEPAQGGNRVKVRKATFLERLLD